jgi:glycosyltransferase involved in cell wall biosynthesis
MEPSKQLSIVIPTYNRAEFLDYSLEVHIPMVREYGIEISIFDNASTDNTYEVVSKWMEEYPYLSYHRSETNIGPDANFERALKYPDTEYIWLLGDTYHIENGSLADVLNIVTSNYKYDSILINVNHEINDIATKEYTDQNMLLKELLWLMTCMSTHIYSKELIKHAQFSRYYHSNFIQVGILLEFISNKEFRLYWNKDINTIRINEINNKKKDLWSENQYFEIWVKNRINFVFSLPVSYSLDSKINSILKDGKDKNDDSIVALLYLRMKKIITLKNVITYWEYFKFITKLHPLIVLCITLIPINLLKILYMFKKGINNESKN